MDKKQKLQQLCWEEEHNILLMKLKDLWMMQ